MNANIKLLEDILQERIQEKRIEKMEETAEEKVCSMCGEKKDLAKFYKNKKSKDGHHLACKACMYPGVRNPRKTKSEQLKSLAK